MRKEEKGGRKEKEGTRKDFDIRRSRELRGAPLAIHFRNASFIARDAFAPAVPSVKLKKEIDLLE